MGGWGALLKNLSLESLFSRNYSTAVADLKMLLPTKITYDIIMVPNNPFSLSAPACASARVRVQQLLGAIPTGLLRISD